MNKGLTVITGANSGNGRALALKLFNEGCKLLLLDLNTNDIEKEISGENVMFAKADVTQFKEIQSAVELAKKKWDLLLILLIMQGL